jgi:RNAse (barnase) inhibitor barstar
MWHNFYNVVLDLRTYSSDLKPPMKIHLKFQETFMDNEGWLWKFFKGLQNILLNLIFKSFTFSLKYTQSLLNLFEYFEAPSFGFKQD